MATYYVKSAGGAGSGLDDANAWSYAKFNSTDTTGHTVLFNRGDTFSGNFTTYPNATYGAYGSGAAPVFSCLLELTSWTLSSGNVYYATLDVTAALLVMLDGIPKAMGRYPKAEYLTVNGHYENLLLYGSSVDNLPFDPAGAEIVIRKDRYVIDRHPIYNVDNGQLYYNPSNDGYYYGNTNNYSPIDGNGFFIQSKLSLCELEGEWYYDNAANRLYMHFGSGTPSGRVVKVASIDYNFSCSSISNISFSNMVFEGSIIRGANLQGASNITLTACTFRNHAANAIYGINSSGVAITNCAVDTCMNNGIFGEYNCQNWTITNNTISNCGVVLGLGKSGDAASVGIFVAGDNTEINFNSVFNVGYNGIDFNGDDVVCENNKVDTYCSLKDDGGGIYSYIGLRASIKKNIVLNGIGAYDSGCHGFYYEPFGKCPAIYLDNGTNDHSAILDQNVLAHGAWCGIFNNNNAGNTITNNLVYDFPYSLYIIVYAAGVTRNLTVTGNQYISLAGQKACYTHLFTAETPDQWGAFNNNTFWNLVDSTTPIAINRRVSGVDTLTTYTLAEWKSLYTRDVDSVISSVKTTGVNTVVFIYNDTLSIAAIELPAGTYKDAAGADYTTSIDLQPYAGAVLALPMRQGRVFLKIDDKLQKHNGKLLYRLLA